MSRDTERRELSSKRMKAGHYRPASETPFKWRFVGGSLVARNCMLSWQGGLLKRTTANNVQNIRPVQNCTGLIFSKFLAVVHVIVTWNFYIVCLFWPMNTFLTSRSLFLILLIKRTSGYPQIIYTKGQVSI